MHDQIPLPSGDYQNFQMHQENKLFKEIEDIEPAKHMRWSEKGLQTIREASHNDWTPMELAKVIHQGWPEHKRDVQPSLRTCWSYRDKLVTYNNIIFKGPKVVIPEQLSPLMLQRAHQSH